MALLRSFREQFSTRLSLPPLFFSRHRRLGVFFFPGLHELFRESGAGASPLDFDGTPPAVLFFVTAL